MNALVRHCQLLLRAYPAAYREIRGEEIIGTLLESTPAGRSWPLPRDIRGLAFSGLRARALFNRQLTTGANLRVAVLAGVAAYLAYGAVVHLSLDVLAEVSAGGRIQSGPVGWPMPLASALTLLAAGLALLTRRRAVVLAAALPAAVLVGYAGPWRFGAGGTALQMALLAALVALVSGSNRPSRRWLVLVGVLAGLQLVPEFAPQLGFEWFLHGVLLAPAAISIVWAVIDARPAITVIVFLLGFYLPIAAEELIMGAIPVNLLPGLGILTVIAVPAVWLLRRQSAHAGRPTRA